MMSQQNAKKTTLSPIIIFVLGAPGSGKGTLCKLFAADYDIYHLSVGDYLRYLINGPLADKPDIIKAVRSGGTQGLVPGQVIVPLLMEKIHEEMDKGIDTFLVDGFPRSLEQNEEFGKSIMSTFTSQTPDLVLLIDCHKEITKKRFLERKRGDDDGEMFERRYADFETRDTEVINFFREKLITVDSSSSLEDSYEQMRRVLNKSTLSRSFQR